MAIPGTLRTICEDADASASTGNGRVREHRIAQNSRSILIRTASGETSFKLLNLSSHGASGHAGVPLTDQHMVTLIFEGGRPVPGRVRWTRGSLAGIEFAARLPLDLLYGEAPRTKSKRARRFTVARSATISRDGQRRRAVICNVSEWGLLVKTVFALLPGNIVDVSCGNLELPGCVVRWSANGRAGLLLPEQLSLDKFDGATAECGL